MDFQMIATLKLIEKGKIIHTIKFENLLSYNFIWDSKELCTLHLVTSNLNINDLNILIAKPYESYVLIGVKKVFTENNEKTYDIPARVFKHVLIRGNCNKTDLTFYETETEEAHLKWIL